MEQPCRQLSGDGDGHGLRFLIGETAGACGNAGT